ncbi:MAG: PQQ-dependent sugar dehydrogenase [Acidobacteriota bacterium]|nr:PQQ-dependent sugar dehydrogenase [Acidobacteriota bacterium]
MRSLRFLPVLLFLSLSAHADVLPGFRIDPVARAQGFVSSVVTDSKNTIYFSTTDGWIYRVDGTAATRVAALPTHAGGNGGLLGMALLDDDTAVVHYTTWDAGVGDFARVLDDVVSRVDLHTGAETVIHSFVCDIQNRERGASSEHHGGNLTVAPDGAIFVGIGEYGGYILAQKGDWNAGKIWRIDRSGVASQWASGMRNPYDLAWDPELNAIVVSDNGPSAGDEIHIATDGANCGWPFTFGTAAQVENTIAPVYVFPKTVAPTGLQRLTGTNPILRRGYLSGAFVTRAIYYLPEGFSDAIPIIEGFDDYVIDVTEAANGEIVFAGAGMSGTTIYRLSVPQRGDCNGDGFVDSRDLIPLEKEIEDGPHTPIRAQEGAYRGSWGCDVNADDTIDKRDLATLRTLVAPPRRRSVRSR